MSKHTEKKHSPGFFGRILRSIVSITILTALVLGITYTVKQISTLNSQKLVHLSSPLLDKLGLNESEVGEVAGALIEKVSDVENPLINDIKTSESTEEVSNLEFKVAIMSDVENDTAGLEKALNLAKEENAIAVFYLGDFTSWGDVESMTKMKSILSESGMTYYAIPGDHDLAASVQDGDTSGLANFKNVFGNYYHSITLNNTKLIIMNNAANYTPIESSQLAWFKNEVVNADFVLLSQPLYHPTIKLYMGIVNGTEIEAVRDQAKILLDEIRQSNVKAIIAGDQHNFSRNNDNEKGNLEHIVTGALVSNDQELRNPQKPRFTILEVYRDGTYKIREVVL